MDGPFKPHPGATVSLDVTTSSGSVEFETGASDVAILNTGSVAVFIRFGGSTVTASATADTPIPAGGWVVLGAGSDTYIAGITASGTATIFVTPGYGF